MAVASVVPHRTADTPVSITLSQFIRFESAVGIPSEEPRDSWHQDPRDNAEQRRDLRIVVDVRDLGPAICLAP